VGQLDNRPPICVTVAIASDDVIYMIAAWVTREFN